MRKTAAMGVAFLLILCCVAAVVGGLVFFFRVPAVEARPVVLIGSPGQGEKVQMGEAVVVQAVARDETGVVRVELWVDGELEEAQRSPLSEGTSPFPLVTRWKPSSSGTHTLAVRAFNADDSRAYVSLSVEVAEVPDRDGDGVADEDDSCPDEAGMGTAAGCPDADGDGVADADDACPAEVGTAEGGGCPLAAEGDRDGDGVPDESDACPDEPGAQVADGCPDGDGDGVADANDACPSEAGLSQLEGCPGTGDLDGDGVNDEDDDCPALSGLAEQGGCPDTDGDGIPDPDDLRPDEPGDPESHGAPDTGAQDSDGDGLPDDVDRCDEEAGSVEHEGCPPPGTGADLNGDDRPDGMDPWGGAIPLWPFAGGMPWDPVTSTVVLDVEALGFQTYDSYDEIHCYIGLAGEPMERYGPFESEAQWEWDIAALLGGENSRVVLLPTGEDLEVRLECSAYQISSEVTQPEEGIGEGGGEVVHFDLGSFTEVHPAEDWNGQPIIVQSEGGVGDRFFRATYRICVDSCEESALPAPHAWAQQVFGGQRFLIWTWDGDPESIDGFHVRYDCYNRDTGQWWVGAEVGTPGSQWARSIEQFEPECTKSCQWYVWAYNDTDGTESPHSNIAVVDGGACARGSSVSVTFYTLYPYDYDRRGPIYGEFWANEEVLSFDGADPANCALGGELECGYYLRGRIVQHVGYSMSVRVGEIFQSIRELEARHPERSYEAPDGESVMVPLPEGDDLTMGFRIYEYHREGEDTLLCSESCTVDYDDVTNAPGLWCPQHYDDAGDPIDACGRVTINMSVWDWEGGG
jgi:hypothetical protein